MLPTVTFDSNKNDTFTFTLWRDGKQVVHEFKGFSVTINEKLETVIHGFSLVRVHGMDERITLPEERAKIDGPSDGGTFYYIYAQPFQGDYTMIWLTKQEAEHLLPMMDAIENSRPWSQRSKCDCPVCGEALAGSVYRPHCSACKWDSEVFEDDYESEDDDGDKAYGEYPRDHE